MRGPCPLALRCALKCALTLASLWMAPTVQASGAAWTATVVHVSDGDTVYVRAAGQAGALPVRVLHIDAPEICQRGGQASRDALAAMVLQRPVRLESEGSDRYGRELARLYVQGLDVGREMVAQGQAWADPPPRQGRPAGPYAEEQRQARAARIGLFAQAQPEPPGSFRRRNGSCHAPP